jgi:flagellin-specific chaperone FliS
MYRSLAGEGASHLGLLLAVYDRIAEDIRQAGLAASQTNIAVRCLHTEHALLLLGHLQSWLALLEEPPLEQTLDTFYQYVRGSLMQLQTGGVSEDFARLALQVSEARSAWYRRSVRREPTGEVLSPLAEPAQPVRTNWSA